MLGGGWPRTRCVRYRSGATCAKCGLLWPDAADDAGAEAHGIVGLEYWDEAWVVSRGTRRVNGERKGGGGGAGRGDWKDGREEGVEMEGMGERTRSWTGRG
ncbi:hypothetical protein EVG20_g10468 [Dentipellis fragilis]|uniref:Uncharacterized protein n=1 Tax=Dentipellis fragilis TaxID=205917 RepID=A0A4Y9XTD5_9AGAM|nr:hypothetical protein EVG20_g10468 [Dentipellis fragilis]